MKFRRTDTLPDAPRRRRVPSDRDEVSNQTFRMGRTLTGSSSAQISSSNELNADLRSPRSHVHHLSHQRKHLFGRFILSFLCVVFLYLIVSQLIATTTVHFYGGASPQMTTRQILYEQRIKQYFDSHPLERFYPNLKRDNLQRFVEAKYPEVETLDLQLSSQFGKTTSLIDLRKPVAHWKIGAEDKFVDDQGIVFDYSSTAAPGVTVIDQSGLRADKAFVSQQFLVFVGSVVGDLRHYGHTVQTVTIPRGAIREIDIRLTGVGYRFKLSVDRSAGQQAEDVTRILRYLKERGSTPQYVDVRVQGKAFYQ